jgi:hypothetical protein
MVEENIAHKIKTEAQINGKYAHPLVFLISGE